MRCASCHRRLRPATACPRCGGASAAAGHSLSTPPRLPAPLTAGALLGRGGFASVWEATDADGRVLAVKIGRADAAPRFAREATALAAVGRACAPELHGSMLGGAGEPVLLMERLHGVTLAELLASLPGSGAMAPARVAALAGALARLVDRVHAAGIVHRDLKPENVFIEAGERPRLIDFGLATPPAGAHGEPLPPSQTLTRSDAIIGTPTYMPPEQAACRAAGPAADRYALGVMLYELLAGRPPFVGGVDEIRRGHAMLRPPPLPGLPRAASAALERFLAKAPDERWPSAAAGAAALAEALAEGAVESATRLARPAPAVPQQRTVGLCGVRSSLALTEITALAAEKGGLVARVREDGVLVLFAGVAGARAVEQADAFAAAACARAGEAACTVLVHAAEVTLRDGARGLAARGEALDAPGWWTAARLPGRHLSDAAAACLPPRDRGAPASPPPAPLLGREPLLAALCAEARRARDRREPALSVIVGEPGTGKSRLLEALAAALAGEPGLELLLVDDAHQLSPAEIDRLEQRLTREREPLFACMAARPSLLERRAGLGGGARASLHRLGPLERGDADRLVRARLLPAEQIGADDLERLWRLTGGLPQAIIEITDALHRLGAIRRHPRAEGHYLAADELLDGAATPLAARLAAQLCAPLPESLRRAVELAAALGPVVSAADLTAAQAELDPRHPARDLDAQVALARLVEAGLLEPAGAGRHRFGSPLLCEAVETSTPPAWRSQNRRAAARALATGAGCDVERLARLAADDGDVEAAAELYERLGDDARAAQRIAEAERAYAAALRSTRPADEPRRLRLLAARGRMRYRVHRSADAGEDLQAAVALALAQGQPALAAELLLELATVADWCDRYAEAELLLARATALAAPAPSPRLSARLALARGRAAYRRQELAVAAAGLLEAAELGERAGDGETRLVSLLLGGAALVSLGELRRAQHALDLAVELGEAAGDRLHLCSALNNREWLWLRRGDLDRALADSQRATALARELGHAPMERATLFNQAELLLWRGEPAAAAPRARRARVLAERQLGAGPHDALLEARIHLALRDDAAAREALAVAGARVGTEPAPLTRLHLDLVSTALARSSAPAWRALVERACRANLLFEAHEVIWLAVEAAAGRGELEEAAALCRRGQRISQDAPLWQRRFAARLVRISADTHDKRGKPIMRTFKRLSLGLAALALVAGCAGEAGEEVAASAGGLSIDNHIATNHIATNHIATNHIATNHIATNTLTTNHIATNHIATNHIATNHIATNGITTGFVTDKTLITALEDPAARELMSYLTSCALDSTQSVQWQSRFTPGLTETFHGALGLCPSWSAGAPTQECLERVSSCILARNNAFGASVLFSMRGLADGAPIPLGAEVPAHDKQPGTNDLVASLADCRQGEQGVKRDCGWSLGHIGTCKPGTLVVVDAGGVEPWWCAVGGQGASRGDTMLRVCDGIHACDQQDQRFITQEEDGCGGDEPAVPFSCPDSGIYAVMVAHDDSTLPGAVDSKPAAWCQDPDRCAYPASEAQVFRWREGGFYGNIFTGLNPKKPEVRVNPKSGVVEEWDASRGRWVQGTERSQAFAGVVYQEMHACASDNWSEPEAYALLRVCAGPDPVSGLYIKNCAAAYAGRCSSVCLTDDAKPVRGDHDFGHCEGGGRRWDWPLTTVLGAPCDFLGLGPWCATVSPEPDLPW